MATRIIQVLKKGIITPLIDLRTRYGVDEGNIFTLIDMGDGSFLLTPQISQVNKLGDRVAENHGGENVSLGDLLNILDEERERYYQEHYVQKCKLLRQQRFDCRDFLNPKRCAGTPAACRR